MPALLRCLRRNAGPDVSDAVLLERFVRERDEAAFELLVWPRTPSSLISIFPQKLLESSGPMM